METVIAVVIGALASASLYLMLSRNILRFILGLTLIGNAANLLIFSVGGMTRMAPPLVPDGLDAPVGIVGNPIPQALVLTAIVISFGVLAFSLVLAYRAHEELGTVDTDAMRVAEPVADAVSRSDSATATDATNSSNEESDATESEDESEGVTA